MTTRRVSNTPSSTRKKKQQHQKAKKINNIQSYKHIMDLSVQSMFTRNDTTRILIRILRWSTLPVQAMWSRQAARTEDAKDRHTHTQNTYMYTHIHAQVPGPPKLKKKSTTTNNNSKQQQNPHVQTHSHRRTLTHAHTHSLAQVGVWGERNWGRDGGEEGKERGPRKRFNWIFTKAGQLRICPARVARGGRLRPCEFT